MMDRYDVVIVGSGVAGLATALGAHGARIALVTSGTIGVDGASPWAQGGIAAALGAGDSPSRHADDTLAAGQFLNDRNAVGRLTCGAHEAVRWLESLGMRFDRERGTYALAREGGHNAARVVHAGGDATGAAVTRMLAAAVRGMPDVEIFEQHRVMKLIGSPEGVAGVWALDAAGTPRAIHARHTVLATGGIGQLYRYTTNPPNAVGSGLALALDVGAALRDLEFVQFHPTALRVGGTDGQSLALVTEAIRGAGATLVDANGHRFMTRIDARGELAPRDIVARAVSQQLREGDVFLDARSAIGMDFPQRFPTVFELCRRHELDPRFELIPVTPAAHYHMGGIAVDEHGHTNVTGLHAVGEVACSGVHGANRLASNSLLEGLVFGRALGARLADGGLPHVDPLAVWGDNAPPHAEPAPDPALVAQLREAMWIAVGVVREREGLEAAIELFAQIRHSHRNTALGRRAAVCAAIAEAALARPTSIGAHYRGDDVLQSAISA